MSSGMLMIFAHFDNVVFQTLHNQPQWDESRILKHLGRSNIHISRGKWILVALDCFRSSLWIDSLKYISLCVCWYVGPHAAEYPPSAACQPISCPLFWHVNEDYNERVSRDFYLRTVWCSCLSCYFMNVWCDVVCVWCMCCGYDSARRGVMRMVCWTGGDDVAGLWLCCVCVAIVIYRSVNGANDWCCCVHLSLSVCVY
jgi:hypothetical protein